MKLQTKIQLILLASMALSVAHARRSHIVDPFAIPDGCKDNKCDSTQPPELNFQAKLSFDQIVIEIDDGLGGLIPGCRHSDESPGDGDCEEKGPV